MKAGIQQNLADGLPPAAAASGIGLVADDDDEEAPEEMIVEAGLMMAGDDEEGHDVGDIADSDNESLEEVNALQVAEVDYDDDDDDIAATDQSESGQLVISN